MKGCAFKKSNVLFRDKNRYPIDRDDPRVKRLFEYMESEINEHDDYMNVFFAWVTGKTWLTGWLPVIQEN